MEKKDNVAAPSSHAPEQDILYQLVRDLLRAPDVQTIADYLFARARNLLSADHGFVGLVNKDGTELHGVASYGLSLDTIRQERMQISSETGPVALAFRQKAPIVVSDLPATSLWSERLCTRYPFIQDICCAPLMNGEKTVGVFVLGYTARRAVTEDDVRLLQLLSDEAALALERAQLIEALQESEARYRRLVEDANDGIGAFAMDGKIISVNHAMERLIGWKEKDLLGDHYHKFVSSDSSSLISERISKGLRGESIPSIYEITVVHKDGAHVPVEIRGRFIRDQQNLPIGYQAIVRDITARRRVENEKKEAAQVNAVLARFGQEMLSSLDTSTTLDRLCQLTTEILDADYGYTMLWQPTEQAYKVVAGYGETAEQREARLAFKVPPERFPHLFSHLKQEGVVERLTEDIRDPVEQSILRRFRIASVLYIPLYHGDNIIGVQRIWYRRGKSVHPRHRRIAKGISQIASLALANAELFEELEQANRIKEEFVGSVSHELRTPLNILLGYNELLQDKTFGPLTTEQEHILNRMRKSALELRDLVNTTLDLSRLQNRRAPLVLQEVHLSSFFADLRADIQQLARDSSLTIDWQTEDSPTSLCTDPVKLRMILKNLLTNALKFTEKGGITVTARQQDHGILFSVHDTGIGLASEMLPFIFEPFRQAETSPARQEKGVGLGLYIVRQLVTMLDGTISVDSELGKGSIFHVWLPLRPHTA